MLLHDFFTFTDLHTEENIVKANIKLNAAHPIFKGHFPNQPVLPGVCMMQMVKEVAEYHLNKKIRLQKALDIKFLSFVDPNQNQLIQIELKINTDENQISLEARLLDAATVLFKFKGTFIQ
jgi:3-hydroxyacyl-[acyl-carrier-protein] dehydratase